jgi:hypothetical protein
MLVESEESILQMRIFNFDLKLRMAEHLKEISKLIGKERDEFEYMDLLPMDNGEKTY